MKVMLLKGSMTHTLGNVALTLNAQLRSLESRFLGPAYGNSELTPDSNSRFRATVNRDTRTRRVEKARKLVDSIVAAFKWFDEDVDRRFCERDVWSIIGPRNADFVFFQHMNGLKRLDSFKAVLASTQGPHSKSRVILALILLQISLKMQILSDEEISNCIVSVFEQQFESWRNANNEHLERFISMIKNVLNEQICRMCITPVPSRLRPASMEFLKSQFQDAGFDVHAYYPVFHRLLPDGVMDDAGYGDDFGDDDYYFETFNDY